MIAYNLSTSSPYIFQILRPDEVVFSAESSLASDRHGALIVVLSKNTEIYTSATHEQKLRIFYFILHIFVIHN